MIFSRFFFVPLILSSLAGCSLADIRPAVLINTGYNESLRKKGEEILDNPNYKELKPGEWKKYKSVQFTIKDVWKSKFVRFFTPIKEDEPRLRVFIDFEKDAMEIEFLSGQSKGLIYGLVKKDTYQVAADTGKVFIADDEVRVYLESLRLYLTLPWRLKEYPILMYSGKISVKGQITKPYTLHQFSQRQILTRINTLPIWKNSQELWSGYNLRIESCLGFTKVFLSLAFMNPGWINNTHEGLRFWTHFRIPILSMKFELKK